MKKINIDGKKVLNFIKNKYVIIGAIFIVLMLFSRNSSIIYFFKLNSQRRELEKRKEYYMDEIKNDSINTINIQKNLDAVEKFGREKYMMKKDSEDIFIIKSNLSEQDSE
ncbi:MAG: septum formation inhibitor [Bacteroidales bacterium]|jgi:cell division protein DivIC|nr:septum formation inhibitor [Bacteroidales bacterium]